MIEIPIWLLIGMLLVLVILGIMLWTLLREREFHVSVPELDSFEEALPSIAGMTKAVILEGNKAEILQNGDQFFPALLDSIARAKETIHFETYVWWTGGICDTVAEAFAARAREGLEVRIMVDALGAMKMKRPLRKFMEKAGCKVARYHPIRLIDIGQLNKRTHRKLAIFDGREAFIMGHGISRLWTGNGQDKEHWRDTGVRLHGPVVNAVQSVFSQHWIEETGEVLVGERYFPHLGPVGDMRMHVLAGAPLGGVSDLELMFKMAIATAQKELIIQNPYFIPDSKTAALLKRAIKRGVEIKIMVPGPVTDSPVVSHAGHRHFSKMLHAGVRIFCHQKTLIHQKIMIIDGLWSHVGSTNLDDRSFDINEEAGVGIIDEGIAAELKAAFEEDRKHCTELKAETWDREYTLWHRAFDRACYLLAGQL
ncbi:MAG TPA: phospholipase D-like domain-containing protein [Thermoanaerobaculia bacterium]|nr:phospholipase D-like domain-containing protein [Thermoanaerobaculia bacterium]